ncbi:helix-turn-helix domain-containing protein [Actinocorallia longicatena]|uniref:Helix-turn-helix domain-containing protein n=1 Tax=Actinocorallia longicatena TaxID=111803 RepID=A0ABP6PZ19_9ACTN
MDLADRLLSVSEAAELLGLDQSRVRQLIRARMLGATKIGGRWILEPGAVRAWALRGRIPRALSPRGAWALLLHLDGCDPAWENPVERHRTRCRAAEVRDGSQLAELVRNRATAHEFTVHPSVLHRIGRTRGLVASGPRPSLADPRFEAYTRPELFEELISRFGLRNPTPGEGRLVLRVPTSLWPFAPETRAASPLVIAIDLLEGADRRDLDRARARVDRALGSRVASGNFSP